MPVLLITWANLRALKLPTEGLEFMEITLKVEVFPWFPKNEWPTQLFDLCWVFLAAMN